MANSYNINYITFSELMAEIEDDLSSLADDGKIEPDKYIKVALTCNSFLSVKINPEKVKTLDIVNSRVKLPSNFKLWESGFICDSYQEYQYPEVIAKKTTKITSKEGCNECPSCNECVETCEHTIIESTAGSYYQVTKQTPIILTQKHYTCEDCDQDYNNFERFDEASIEKDGDDLYLLLGVNEGKIVIRYTSNMEDGKDLIIYDHPLVREYYEYAIKEKIFENAWLNGMEVYNKYQLMKEEHRKAKIAAKRFVQMPDFAEIKEYWVQKRRRRYDKYFKPFYTSNNKRHVYNQHRFNKYS